MTPEGLEVILEKLTQIMDQFWKTNCSMKGRAKPFSLAQGGEEEEDDSAKVKKVRCSSGSGGTSKV